MKLFAVTSLVAVAVAAVSAAVQQRGSRFLEPAGPGIPEPTMDKACAECAAHAPHLDECVCFATDVMGTFEDDATKELTTRKGYGFQTEQTGKTRLQQGWHWHCRPVTATENVWKQCP